MTIPLAGIMLLCAAGGALIGALLVWLWVWNDNHHTDFAMKCHKCNEELRLRKSDGWLYSMHRVALFSGNHTQCRK